MKHTSEAPVLGRSQMSTRLPAAASSWASSRTPGESLLNRPPGVMTQDGAVADHLVGDRQPVDHCGFHSVRLAFPVMAGNVHSVAEPTAVSASKVFADMFVVDADSHWSEPADLFTSRAPAEVRDRVLRSRRSTGSSCGCSTATSRPVQRRRRHRRDGTRRAHRR